MQKRGRPKTNTQPFSMLERVAWVVFAYHEERRAGEKHIVAIQGAVERIRKEMPRVPISATEVRRILAQWCPTGGPTALSVSVPTADNSVITLPNGLVFRVLLNAHLGPRIRYPRANAVSPLAETK
jgi:hypothetical protein